MKVSIKTNALLTATFILALIAISLFQFPRLQFDSNLLALFPKDQQRPAVTRATELMSDWLSDKLIVLVSSQTSDVTANELTLLLARKAEEIFSSSPAVSRVILERDASQFSALLDLYRQHSTCLVPEIDYQLLNENPEQFVQRQIRRVFQSPGAINSDHFLQDPFDFSTRYFMQASPNTGTLFLQDGYLSVEAAGRHYLMLEVRLAGSAYSVGVQEQIVELLARVRGQLAEISNDAQVLANGPVLFAAAGSHQAKKEISTVGTGSLLGVLVLLLLVFRSFPILLMSMVPTAVGIVMGMLAVSFAFGPVHIVAMVFGASLVGVSIDYTLHFFVTRLAMSTEDSSLWTAEEGVRRLFNGLTLGLLTSSLAYLSFVFSGFPGFQQIAVFSAAGLLGAWLTVMGLFPFLFAASHKMKDNVQLFSVARKVIAGYLGIKMQGKWLAIVAILASVSLIAVLAGVETTDDIRKMQKLDAQLVTESKHFDDILGQHHVYQFMLVKAESPEILLQHLESLEQKAAAYGTSGSHIARWIPSQQKQRRAREVLSHSLQQDELLARYFNALHIHPEKRADITKQLLHPNDDVLEFGDVYSLLEQGEFQPLYFQSASQHYGIATWAEIKNVDKLRELAADTPWLEWVDQVDDTSDLLKTFRLKSSWLLLFAYFLVFLLLTLRYRIRGALGVVMAPLLGSMMTLAILVSLNYQINVFNIMGALLVLGIGIDYSLFLRESKKNAHETWVAIALSAVTTILAFGLLSLSETFAIQSFGVSVLLGISFCLLLAPLLVTLPESRFIDKRVH